MNDVMPSHVIPKKIKFIIFLWKFISGNVSGKIDVISFIVPTKSQVASVRK